MGDFITASDLASHLQTDLDTASANLAILAAEATVRNVTNQTISRVVGDTHTVYNAVYASLGYGVHYWQKYQAIELPERPADPPTLVTVDGLTITDWLWQFGSVQRLYGWGTTTIITYSHGYTTIPEDVKTATRILAAKFYANPRGLSSETAGLYTYDESGSDPLLTKLLGRYTLAGIA